MGDVGDQDRRAVRVNADRPVQPWLLTSHERQEALQSGFVILGGGNRPIRTGLVSGLNYRDGRHESCRVQIRAAGAAHTRNFHGNAPRYLPKLAHRRLDAPHRRRAGAVDHSVFFCASRRISHPRTPDDHQLVVGRTNYPMQIRFQMFCKRGGFGGVRRKLSGPEPANYPCGAIQRGAKRRNREGFPGRSPESLARTPSTEDRHRVSVPASSGPRRR